MKRPGLIYTFYSYKGGVGRSMALANVAALMAKAGYKVLVVDFDLEAPGIDKYLDNGKSSYLLDAIDEKSGIVDLIYHYKSHYSGTNGGAPSFTWRDCLLDVSINGKKDRLSILSAGKNTEDYISKLQALDWNDLFDSTDFGNYLEAVRNQWRSTYDFVLIDSRTGITDIGGICTIHLPDVLVFFFTTNEASIEGCHQIISAAIGAHQKLPFQRNRLVAVPVPSRDESRTEYESAYKWRKIIAEKFEIFYNDWLYRKAKPKDILDVLRIPYIPYWSFGERLPVLEEGTKDPTSIGYAYDVLTRLLTTRLDWEMASSMESAQDIKERHQELKKVLTDKLEESQRVDVPVSTNYFSRFLNQITAFRKRKPVWFYSILVLVLLISGTILLDSRFTKFGNDQLKLGQLKFELGEYDEAFVLFQTSAKTGNVDAMNRLAQLYRDSLGTAPDFERAFEWFSKAANRNNAAGMNGLGQLYEHGLGVKQDFQKSLEWYTKAAEAGNTAAMNNIGMLYDTSEGVYSDYLKALDWYTKAAEAGNADAMYNLGKLYNAGLGINRDVAMAFEWYTKAAKAGQMEVINGKALLNAVSTGDMEKVREILLKDDVDVNQIDIIGETPLYLAASGGYVELVRQLLAQPNINVNPYIDPKYQAGNYALFTPLTIALHNLENPNKNPELGKQYENFLMIIKLLAANGGENKDDRWQLYLQNDTADEVAY
ncbi:AAA family ATPase [Fulvivirgaceae bacterium BMA12]|uniref:AAA family ATPase n=1 Tax=Agaribacillus aureus TaxID=3051825 RepID=A0ABT8LHR1_9BACT|nr:AAA family ATPase [Fulvivirgaceae bacterium BMA12]